MNNEEIINKYIELAEYNTDYSSKKSVRKHNNNLKKLDVLFDIIKKNPELIECVYGQLLENENAKVLLYASVDCLKLKVYEKKAIKLLQEISKREDIGITAFEAETCLKIYNGEYPGRSF